MMDFTEYAPILQPLVDALNNEASRIEAFVEFYVNNDIPSIHGHRPESVEALRDQTILMIGGVHRIIIVMAIPS